MARRTKATYGRRALVEGKGYVARWPRNLANPCEAKRLWFEPDSARLIGIVVGGPTA